MKRLLIALCLVVLFVSPALAADVQLSWDAPTTNEDGTPLTDLAGFTLYYYTTSGGWQNPQGNVDVGNVLTYTISVTGDTFFIATAYDTSGNESGPSNEVFFGLSPAVPTNLRLGN